MKRKRALKNFTPEVRRDLSWISVWMKVTSEKGFWWGFWDQSTSKDRVSEWRRDGSWNEWTDCYVEGGQRENGHVKRDRKKKGGNGQRPSSSSANIYLRICKDQTGYQKKTISLVFFDKDTRNYGHHIQWPHLTPFNTPLDIHPLDITMHFCV